jgi:hypothetical protein
MRQARPVIPNSRGFGKAKNAATNTEFHDHAGSCDSGPTR